MRRASRYNPAVGQPDGAETSAPGADPNNGDKHAAIGETVKEETVDAEWTAVNNEDLDDDEDENDEDDGEDEPLRFVPGESLPRSIVAKRGVLELVNLLEAGHLDLDAEYQRDVVWPSDRMTALVTSMIEDFYIPPLIFNVTRIQDPESGEERLMRICVDGKQRISSVRAFLAGEIPVLDRSQQKWYYKATRTAGGAARRQNILPETWRQKFCRKELFCYELEDLSLEQEEDLFSRVQMGVALTPAEKLRASRGPWQEFATLFERDFPGIVQLTKDKRSSGWLRLLACFSQVMEVEAGDCEDGSVPALKASSAAVKKLVAHPELLDEALKSRLMRTFTTFARLLEQDPNVFHDNQRYARVKSFAPVELLAVAVLISHYGESRSNELLLGDIQLLREELRRVHQDLRMNTSCWRTVWAFIDTLERIRGATDGTTRAKANQESARTGGGARGGRRAAAAGVDAPTQADSTVAKALQGFSYAAPSSQSADGPRRQSTTTAEARSGSVVSSFFSDRTSRSSVANGSAGGNAIRQAQQSARRQFAPGRVSRPKSPSEPGDDTTRASSSVQGAFTNSTMPSGLRSFGSGALPAGGSAATNRITDPIQFTTTNDSEAGRSSHREPSSTPVAPVASMAGGRRKRNRLDLGELDLKRIKPPPLDD